MADRRPGELPVPGALIRGLRRHAFGHPWAGNQPLTCPRHTLDTEAILEPGRPTRLLVTFDVGYHGSGWFKNSDYEQCLHISVSHPRRDRPRLVVPKSHFGVGPSPGVDIETPSEAEVWEWARAFFVDHASLAWVEPAASTFDAYRMPNIVHARLYYDRAMRPIQPEGEPYSPLRPWSEKVLGSLGGDVR